jgi:hypothetical protein
MGRKFIIADIESPVESSKLSGLMMNRRTYPCWNWAPTSDSFTDPGLTLLLDKKRGCHFYK